MSEMKFVSDPTKERNFRFIAQIDDTADNGERFKVLLVPGSGGNPMIVGIGGNAIAAKMEIDQLVELLLQAKNMLTKFSSGTRDFTEPLPKPAEMPKIGGGSL